jgi:hypothetical protein
MRPVEKQLTTEERVRVQLRGYRTFIRDHEDGSQELIIVHDDSTLVTHATRADRWKSWSAPTYFLEISY